MNKLKLILDMSIGDGYLQKAKTPNGKNPLIMKHSSKQADYALWKKQILEENGIKCSIDSYTDTKGYNICQIRTSAIDLTTEARKKLYINNIKTLSKEVLSNFDQFSLAILFQDDGSREHCKWHRVPNKGKIAVKTYINAFLLHVNNFTDNECNLLIDKIKELGINSRLIKRKNRNTIIISKKEDKEKFSNLIKPLLHSSMFYKIDTPVKYYGNL